MFYDDLPASSMELLSVRCRSIPGIPTPLKSPQPLHNKINERAKLSG